MIPAEVVKQMLQRGSATRAEPAPEIVEAMCREQPLAFNYLLSMSKKKPFDEHDGQIVFFVGLVVWQIMKQSPGSLRKVTTAKLEQAEKANE